MSRPSVYLETSVIGYAAMRKGRDIIVAAHRRISREWLASEAKSYELFVSEVVIREVSAGDKTAARERLALLAGITVLVASPSAGQLAARLVDTKAIPSHSKEDALHIAVAAVHGIDFLVTWNYKHIANATRRTVIEQVCRRQGFVPPVICTPEELRDAEVT